MSGAPARGTVPRRQRRHHHHHHHHHHQKHPKHARKEPSEEPEEKRPKVNPIFLWASQREQRIVEVRCEDYDKRNRIKLTKTAQGWRSIPRTTSNIYSTGLGTNQEKKTTPACTSSSSTSNEEKENGKTVTATSINNNLIIDKESIGKKRRYENFLKDKKYSQDYYPLENLQNGVRVSSAEWKRDRRRVSCSEGEEEEEEEEEEDDDDDEDETENEEQDDNQDDNQDDERKKGRSFGHMNLKNTNGKNNLERLQKDIHFQPRVVLEHLHLSQLPDHRDVLLRRSDKILNGPKEVGDTCNDDEKNEGENEEPNNERRNKDIDGEEDEEDEDDDEEDEEEEEEEPEEEEINDERNKCRENKEGIQDILNMIDATASPVLATDTPSADLPMHSNKTFELVLSENVYQKKISDKKSKDLDPALPSAVTKNKSRTDFISNYQKENVENNDNINDCDQLEVHEEKIHERCNLNLDERKNHVSKESTFVACKNNSSSSSIDIKSCKVAEADGGISRSKSESNSLLHKWKNNVAINVSKINEEALDEPGGPTKIDYSSSSTILNALRNTPGLSVSITRAHPQEVTKNVNVPSSRPSSKSSSSSRSPDSQAENVERLLKGSMIDYSSTRSFDVRGQALNLPRNLPGLSIVIPNYRYRNISNSQSTTNSTSPKTKDRVESPESTVNFPKTDFPHEEEEERDLEDDEDDCDSQVLEDLRRQKVDSLVFDSVDSGCFLRSNSKNNQDDRNTPIENAKDRTDGSAWNGSSRSSEAQAKCKYQDVEHFDEQVLEELRSRGTVVSPQPSGIPCSPASKRPSSAYLERLLPSPPCSVSCSEDAKNDLTLKGILSSPSCLENKDYDRNRENTSNRCEPGSNEYMTTTPRSDYSKDNERSNIGGTRRIVRTFQEHSNVQNQDMKNSGRPMSNSDIHSSLFISDRSTAKKPMSAEWTINRLRKQAGYHKILVRSRMQSAEYQEAYATSTSTDKLLDPANQLRELIETSGHLIPDPLLVPRDYLPALAAAPATEIPKLLTSRPELRLPEALTRPDLLRDPDLLVISLSHLQHVLDHGEGPVSRSRQSQSRIGNGVNKGSSHANNNGTRNGTQIRPKLSCKPIGTLMPAPIDLSSNRRSSPYPPLLRVRTGLLKQEPEVSSTANSPDDSQLWHPLFGSQKRQLQQQQQIQQQQQQQHQQHQYQHQFPHPHQHQNSHQHQNQQQHQHQHQHQHQQHQHASWHRTTLAS